MRTLKVRFSEKSKQLITNKTKNYFELLDRQCIDIFLPDNYNYQIVDENEKADICILGVQHTNNNLLRDNEVNIFLSLENLGCGRTHYQFHNMFGDNMNRMVNIHLHNHYSKPLSNILPVVDSRIRYFRKIYDGFKESCNIPFKKKKFCLFTSQNMLNNCKSQIGRLMSQLGPIESMSHHPQLKNVTCYNSLELLKVFNQYKFIICCENSNTNGYITEKIFNVFCSRSIPIYNGAPDINNYINNKAYIGFDSTTNEAQLLKKIRLISQSADIYNRIIAEEKINPSFKYRYDDYLKTLVK